MDKKDDGNRRPISDRADWPIVPVSCVGKRQNCFIVDCWHVAF